MGRVPPAHVVRSVLQVTGADMTGPGRTPLQVGLVLGGGGAVGAAFHAGVLAALRFELGWDARSAARVVGTSAGSVVGSLVCLNVPLDDIAALLVDAPLRTVPAAMADAARRESPVPEQWWREYLRPPTLRRPAAALDGLVRLYRRGDPTGFASALARSGRVDFESYFAFLSAAQPTWPTGLAVCAVEQRTHRRRVFDGTGERVALGAAVAASCAVPGLGKPVDIGGTRFVDGGVHSATNADVVVAGGDLDLVIVSSPMSGRPGAHPAAALRAVANRQLAREVDRVEAGGVPVVVFEPSPALHDIMGVDLMDGTETTAVVREAFLHAGDVIAERRNRALLAGLAGTATGSAATSV